MRGDDNISYLSTVALLCICMWISRCSVCRAAVTNYHKFGGLKQLFFLSHSSGGQKPIIRVSAAWAPSGHSEGDSVSVPLS